MRYRAPSGIFGTYPDDDVDAANLGPLGRQRIAADDHVPTRDVLKLAGRFAEEVMVIGRIGVEIGAARFDDDFAKQPRIGELMKGVVDRRERHLDRRSRRFAVQLLGGDMALPVFEQDSRQGEALAEVYAAADVFVFPSRTDTFGLVLLEALASGVPVAAFPAAAPRDVIGDAPVGCLDEDLARACLGALEYSRADCREFALRMTWAESARIFLEHVTQATRPKRKIAA